jgi:hypothetical protein
MGACVQGNAITYVQNTDFNMYEFMYYPYALNTAKRQTIEGYLAWKWSIEADLPTNHPYLAATPTLYAWLPTTNLHGTQILNGPTGPSGLSEPIGTYFINSTSGQLSQYISTDINPNSVSSLRLWLDASDSSTLTLNNTSVTQWNDKSGQNYNLTSWTNTVGAGNPNIQTSSGTTGVRFNSNAALAIPQAAINNANAYSIFIAYKPNTANNIIMNKTGGNLQNTLTSGYFETTGGLNWYAMNGVTITSSPNIVSVGVIQIFELVYDGSTIFLYKNGIPCGSSPDPQPPTYRFAILDDTAAESCLMGLYVQNNTIKGDQTTDFNMYEFLYYPTNLDSTKRQSIEGYLGWKWGIQSSLPTGHPYYSVRPS